MVRDTVHQKSWIGLTKYRVGKERRETGCPMVWNVPFLLNLFSQRGGNSLSTSTTAGNTPGFTGKQFQLYPKETPLSFQDSQPPKLAQDSKIQSEQSFEVKQLQFLCAYWISWRFSARINLSTEESSVTAVQQWSQVCFQTASRKQEHCPWEKVSGCHLLLEIYYHWPMGRALHRIN